MATPPPDDVKVLYTLLDPVNDSVIQEFKATQDAKVHSSYLTNFREGSPLGEGGFAVVTKCQNVLDEQWYAVKKAFMAEEDEDTGKPRYLVESYESLKAEAKTLAALDHPNIVRFHMSWTETNFSGTGSEEYTVFTNSPCLFILQELCESTWTERLKNMNKEIADGFRAQVNKYNVDTFRGIVNGLAYLHDKDIMHGDLTPSNILHSHGVPKIADFGLARKVGMPMGGDRCLNYHALEMKKGVPAATSVDIFSLGMILFEILQPFGSNQGRLKKMEDLAKNKTFPECWAHDNQLRILVNSMIDDTPSERPSAAYLKEKLDGICDEIRASRLPAE